MVASPATDETVRLIWEGVIGADRMCRYYGYLTNRLSRLGELLTIGTVSFSLGAVLTILNRLPEWVALVAIAVAVAAGVVMAVGRYPQKAARSGEVYRALGALATEWEELWSGVYERDDADLRTAWVGYRVSSEPFSSACRASCRCGTGWRCAASARPTSTGRGDMLPHKEPRPQSSIRPEYPPRRTTPPPPPPPRPKTETGVERKPAGEHPSRASRQDPGS